MQQLRGHASPLVLLYYAGHALTFGGQMYLIPVDANKGKLETYVNLHELLRSLHDITAFRSQQLAKRVAEETSANPAPGALCLVILDCCRSRDVALAEPTNDIFQKITAGSRYRKVDSQFCVLFACDDGAAADEDQDTGHGFLTESLLHCLRTHQGMKLFELFEAIIDRCQQRSKFRQRPWFQSCCREASSLVLHPA